ncbi:hypothetical protein V2J09_001614 [Rumex salicifolius]
MGSCTSAQRKSSASSSWKLRPSLVHSETDKHSNLVTSESVKEKPESVVGIIDQPFISSHGYTSRVSPFNSVSSFSNCGSKEEAFFDTQGWLESDCDEFYSVNGDFTSSRGSTPNYRSIPGTPLNRSLSSSQVNRAFLESRSPPFYAAESNRSSRGTTPLHMSVSGTAPRPDSDAVGTTECPPPEQIKRKSMTLGDLFRESIRERQAEESESANADSFITHTDSQNGIAENNEKHLKHPQDSFLHRLDKILVVERVRESEREQLNSNRSFHGEFSEFRDAVERAAALSLRSILLPYLSAREEMACDEAELGPEEFAEKMQSQHQLQEQKETPIDAEMKVID